MENLHWNSHGRRSKLLQRPMADGTNMMPLAWSPHHQREAFVVVGEDTNNGRWPIVARYLSKLD